MEEAQSPRVTALVVSRDEADTLRRCLERLEASAQRDRLEILVVDDGSADNTGNVLADFTSVVTLRIPKMIGWTRAVNIGLRTAKGDAIFLLRPDTLVRPETIASLADKLESDSDIGAVCPAAARVWSFPSPAALSEAWRTGELPGGISLAGEMATDYPKDSALLVRRGFLRAMNFLDQRFGEFWSDLELCSRIRGGGKKIVAMGDVPVDRSAKTTRSQSDLEWADSAHGIATWIGLHHGFVPGLQFRIGAVFHALGRGRMGAVMAIASASKIDGNQ